MQKIWSALQRRIVSVVGQPVTLYLEACESLPFYMVGSGRDMDPYSTYSYHLTSLGWQLVIRTSEVLSSIFPAFHNSKRRETVVITPMYCFCLVKLVQLRDDYLILVENLYCAIFPCGCQERSAPSDWNPGTAEDRQWKRTWYGYCGCWSKVWDVIGIFSYCKMEAQIFPRMTEQLLGVL